MISFKATLEGILASINRSKRIACPRNLNDNDSSTFKVKRIHIFIYQKVYINLVSINRVPKVRDDFI